MKQEPMVGVEPTNLSITNRVLYQLSYIGHDTISGTNSHPTANGKMGSMEPVTAQALTETTEPTTARLSNSERAVLASRARRIAQREATEQARLARQNRPRTAIEQPSAASVTRHPAYKCWKTMRQRCLNPNNPNFARYGGRGIRISERWNDFPTFAADMGERPDRATLERIDNDGHYEPGNVRWASREEQGQNRHDVRPFTFDGRTQTLTRWVREWNNEGKNPHQLHISTIRARLSRLRWSIERTMGTPSLDPSHDRHLYAEAPTTGRAA